jgi:hypothetical protein
MSRRWVRELCQRPMPKAGRAGAEVKWSPGESEPDPRRDQDEIVALPRELLDLGADAGATLD